LKKAIPKNLTGNACVYIINQIDLGQRNSITLR
jgi:hypothetical protein